MKNSSDRFTATHSAAPFLSVGKPATASALAVQLSRGETTAISLVEDALSRCDDPRNESVFIHLDRAAILRDAEASDVRRARGATLGDWDGVPVAWKDLFDIAGQVTTAGSATRRDAEPAESDADVVAACRERGLLTFGKTNLSEFAFSGLGLNPHFGTPVNPFSGKVPRIAGGSSSGSAVAVANGIVPIAVGTDTSGSIRVPASFCGVYGFKASADRYPSTGCFPLSPTLDSLGIFANSAEDLIAMDASIRGTAAGPAADNKLKNITFIIPQSVVFDNVDSEVFEVFNRFVAGLHDGGVQIVRRTFPVFEEVRRLFGEHGTITLAEAAALHQALLESEAADLMDPRVRSRMLSVGRYSASDYVSLQWARRRLLQDIACELGDALLLFPTVAIQPPPLSDLQVSDDAFHETNEIVLRNTMIGSYLDMPGISIPIGITSQGFPVGVLVSGLRNTDDRVLSVACQIDGYCS